MIQQPIPFKVTVFLRADLANKIRIDHGQGYTIIGNNDHRRITIDLSYNGQIKIPFLKVSGFKADPTSHVKIEKFEINGYPVRDFNSLLSFDMKDNAYVEQTKIQGTDMIDFNGSLNIEPKLKDRLVWFPYSYSTNRNHMMYLNSILNCQSEYGCYAEGTCLHDPPYKLFDPEGCRSDTPYDFVTLGCSFTSGTGIKKSLAWPSLLAENGKEVLNLGIPGVGNDAILLNAKQIKKRKIKFRKMIILLPDDVRRLFRVKKHGLFFGLQLATGGVPKLSQGEFNIFFQKAEYDKIMEAKHREMILKNNPKRDDRIIKRLISFLESNDIDFYISSWSSDTYATLKRHTQEKNLLPMFNEEQDRAKGKDGSHPAEHIHKKWVNSIWHRVNSGK